MTAVQQIEIVQKEFENQFVGLRKKYLEARTTENGWDVLYEMMQIIPTDENEKEGVSINDTVEHEIAEIVEMIISDISCEDLFIKNQIRSLEFIPLCTPRILELIAKILNRKPDAPKVMKQSAMAVAVAFARRLTESEAHVEIAKLLATIASEPMILEELKDQLKGLKGMNAAEERFRIYQVLIEAAKVDCYQPALQPILETTFYDATNNNDYLTQLAAIDILSDIALANNSMTKVLYDLGYSGKIYDMLMKSKSSPDAGFVYDSCIRFFSTLTRHDPSTIDKFPDFVKYVIDMVLHFDHLDATSRLLAFDSFANICYDFEVKKKLMDIYSNTEMLDKALKTFGFAINTGPMEMRVRTIEAAEQIFENAGALAYDWLVKMGDLPFVTTLILMTKKPFPELSKAALTFIQTLFQYPQCASFIVDSPSFEDWHLGNMEQQDFESEYTKKQLLKSAIRMAENGEITIEATKLEKYKNSLIKKEYVPEVEVAL